MRVVLQSSRCDPRSPQRSRGVTRNVRCTLTKLYQAKYSASMALRFVHFFEKPFVSRVNRRMCIRMLKLALSTYEVQILSGKGFPNTGVGMHSATSPGE
jgi:hypothetical protein